MFFRVSMAGVILLGAVVSAGAHDPGLSNLHLKLQANRVEAVVTLAQTDLEPLVPVDRNRDGRIDASEMESARPALEKLAARAIDIFFDDRQVSPIVRSVTLDDSNDFEFRLDFVSPPPARLKIRSNMIRELAAGHRQYVRLDNSSGESLGEVLFSAKDNLAEIDLAPGDGGAAKQKTKTQRLSWAGFLKLGVEHILTGYDHLLFLFGLLLVCGRWVEVAKIVTCFTLAHSLTLALAGLDLVNIPGRIVEPAIAASIIYVGVENMLSGGKPRGRWLLTFCFGLVHGFGFAGALREFGFGGSGGKVIAPLLSFNLGVELGQIAVAAVLLPFLWQIRKNAAYASRWMPALSAVVALLGAYWFGQRVWG